MGTKISEFTLVTPDGTEYVECIISPYTPGTNRRITTQSIADLGGGGGAVDSVNGQTGVVVLDAGDIGVTPAGGIAATDVQAALAELDSEKQASLGFTPENVANKATDFSTINNTLYPTVQAVNERVVGVQDLFIPAAAMWPRITGGCGVLTQYEMATSLFNIQGLPFDQTTQEFAQFQVVFPRKWNVGTVTVVPYWTAQSGSGDVQWGISGGAYSNDDALTVALGSAQTSDDTLIATNDLHIGPATSAITLAGTPASADFLALQVSRNPASDTLSGDAILLGISVRITTTAAIDA
jgi:hypothetical protein